MPQHIGRTGQTFLGTESTYGTAPTLTATDAVRHRTLTLPSDNKDRRTIIQKKSSPGVSVATRTDQRKRAAWNFEAVLQPSGTLNTLPEAHKILLAGFGSHTNVTLATTVASGASVNGATLASGAGLAVGGAVSIVCPDGRRRVRVLSSVAGAVVGWVPSLPTGQTPDVGGAVTSALVYRLTTPLSASLTVAHYLRDTANTIGLSRQVTGAGVDRLGLKFDANDDPILTVSGPARAISTPAAHPGAFTTVGLQPPSGITGELGIGAAATALTFMKLSLDITNGLAVRLDSYGRDAAEEIFRKDRRAVAVTLDCRAEDRAILYDQAEAGTNVALIQQTGWTAGNIVAVYAPAVEFQIPDTDDPDDVVNWPFKGMALETVDGANDELCLVLA